MLGHKSAALTLDTYADLCPDNLDAVADALDAAARASLADERPHCCTGQQQRPYPANRIGPLNCTDTGRGDRI
jgi:hypothetical protein